MIQINNKIGICGMYSTLQFKYNLFFINKSGASKKVINSCELGNFSKIKVATIIAITDKHITTTVPSVK